MVQMGRTEEAMRELDRIAADFPDSPLPPIQRGDILRSKERFPEAIAAYTSGIAKIAAAGRRGLAGVLRSRHRL